MAEILWKDKRSDKRKVVRLDILVGGESVAEIDHTFDPNDGASIAGAVMEIGAELREGYKLNRVNTTLGQVRKNFVARILRKGIRSAC